MTKHRGVAIDDQCLIAVHVEHNVGSIGFRPHDRVDFVEERREHHRLELQIFRARELEKALNDLVETPNLARDDVDMLQRVRGTLGDDIGSSRTTA